MPTDPVNLTGAKPKRPPKCPVCGKPTAAAFRPFCSKRCADVDLSRWLGEVYRVPTEGDQGRPDDPDSVSDESR